MQKNKSFSALLRYNNHICYVSNANIILQARHCPNCDTLFDKAPILESRSTTCSAPMKIFYPRNVYQIQETPFVKLDSSGIKYTSEQYLLKTLALFDFELVRVQEETFKDTNATTWIGKNVSESVSFSSNIIIESISLCNFSPNHIVAAFIGSLRGLNLQNKFPVRLLFLDIERKIKIKLRSILEKLAQRHNQRDQTSLNDCDNKVVPLISFTYTEKNNRLH